MTSQALFELLKTTGLQVAYRKWKTPPPLPYLVYLFVDESDLVADNRNYVGVSNWQVELYSEDKDEESEAAVEAVLDAAGIPYVKREDYIEAEELTQVLYLISTI